MLPPLIPQLLEIAWASKSRQPLRQHRSARERTREEMVLALVLLRAEPLEERRFVYLSVYHIMVIALHKQSLIYALSEFQ